MMHPYTVFFDELTDCGALSQETCQRITDGLDEGFAPLRQKTLVQTADWGAVRQLWAFAHMEPPAIPLNAANLCPAPLPVIQAINAMRLVYNEDVSQQIRTRQYALTICYAREAIAEALGAAGEATGDVPNVALVRNASEANNVLSNGFKRWRAGNVVVWSENHPTNLGAWQLRAERFGFSVKEVVIPKHPTPETIYRAFDTHIDDHTRLLTFSETSNASGLRIPQKVIQKLGERTRALGIHVHMDGAQTWGAQALDLGDLPIESFAASAHKWFFGPKETGVLYMRPERVADFEPLLYAYDDAIQIPPWNALPTDARRFALLGQRDDANLMGLFLTQCLHRQIGAKTIETRIRELATMLRAKLSQSDWMVSTPEGELSHGVLVTEVAEADRLSLYNFLYDEERIAASTAGGLRLCPHIYNIYNNEADLDLVVRTMNRWRDQRRPRS